MKFLACILISIIATTSFAESRIPTIDESNEIDRLLKSSNSLSELITSIERDKLDPMYSWYKGPISTPEQSTIFNKIIVFRFDPIEGYKGNYEENLKLINLLFKKGLNASLIQPSNFLNGIDLYPVTSASQSCSIELLNIVINHGADINQDTNLWLKTLRRKLSTADENLKDNCEIMTNYYLKNSKTLALDSLFDFFAELDNEITFARGDMVHQVLSNQSLSIIKERFGVKFNTEPKNSSIPDDVWFAEFEKYLGRPMQNTNFKKSEALALEWWNQQSTEMKQWSCYYSSFNETYDLLIANNADPESLLNFPADFRIGKKYRGFGSFAIDVLRPYCNSIN